jgi:eukaryotic-like serine/threonine-protein kinase
MKANEGGRSNSDSLSASQAEELDRACDQFEARWRAGEPPKIEDYLAGVAGAAREVLACELIAIDVHWRRHIGEHPTLAGYLARFPYGEASVKSAFGTGDLQQTALGLETRPSAVLQTPGITVREGMVGEDVPTFHSEICPLLLMPGYEILGELGRGGMGVVYKARQVRLNRTVAVKMILAGLLGGREIAARFLAESRAIAKLQHPNIVQIFHTEEHDGCPYLEMEYVDGGNLSGRLDGVPRPPREAARLIETLALAMAEAHRHGVIHRDLKPSNILLTKQGMPKIADFGLAKFLDVDQGLTQTDSVLGSPSYMAPEQADGKAKHIGPTADVYALGAILYELLTGRPPFRGESVLDTLQQVRESEPVSPSRLVPGLPRDIETILLKCLQKDPKRRYDSATAMAEDLRRFQADEPVVARPVGWAERSWRWCRRNPTPAFSIAAVAGALCLGTVVSMTFAVAARTEAGRAKENEIRAATARSKAQAQLIDLATASGLSAARQHEHAQALLWFTHAVRLAADDPERQRVGRIRVRNWSERVVQPDYRLVLPGFRSMQDRFLAFEFHVSGRFLLVVSTTGAGLIWDLDRRSELPIPDAPARLSAAAFSPDGRLLALGTPDGKVEVRDFPTMKLVAGWDTEGTSVTAIVFSLNALRLAISDRRGARVWDVERKTFLTPRLPHPAPVETIRFDRSGRRLVTVAGDRMARTFTLAADSVEPLYPPIPHSLGHFGVSHGGADAVAPQFVDGDRVLLTVRGWNDKSDDLVWRDAATGTVLHTSDPPGPGKRLTSLSVDPEGKTVAAFWSNVGRIFRVPNGELLAVISFEETWYENAEFSPSGEELATVGHDTFVKFRSINEPQDLSLRAARHPLRHPAMTVRVRYSPDGARLAVAQWDGIIYVWKFPTVPPEDFRIAKAGPTRVAFSRDGRLAMLNGTSYKYCMLLETRVYESDTSHPSGPPLKPGGVIIDAAFSPDGKSVCTASSAADTPNARAKIMFEPDGRGGTVQIWDWAAGTRRFEPIKLPTEPRGLDYHPDGSLLAVTCADGWVVLVDSASGTIRRVIDTRVRSTRFPANLWWSNGQAKFTPDGRRLLTWEMNDRIHIWDPATGEKLADLSHEGRIETVAFGSDPNLMITCARDSQVRVWDLREYRLAAPPLKHPRLSPNARFTPDGDQIESVSDDGIFRVWDWRQNRSTAIHRLSDASLIDFAKTPDRRWLMTTGSGLTQLSDALSGSPIAPPLYEGLSPNLRVTITPNGRRAIVSGFAQEIIGYDLPRLLTPADEAVKELVNRAELISGLRVMENLELMQLTPSERGELWERRVDQVSKTSQK